MCTIRGGIDHCDSQIKEYKVGVPVNSDVQVSMCAVSYPKPTHWVLQYRGMYSESLETVDILKMINK